MRTINKAAFHSSLITLSQIGQNQQEGQVMYLKKVDGPRAVTLPDGSIMTRADLPPASTRRWVASRKAAVVTGVVFGLIPLKEALKLYGLSQEEYDSWRSAIENHGENALKTTSLQKYRQL